MSSEYLQSEVSSKKMKKSFFRGILQWLKRNETRLVVFVVILVCFVIGFQAGMLFGKEYRAEPLVIEKIREDCPLCAIGSQTPTTSNTSASVVGTATTTGGTSTTTSSSCMFVGSKNSNKYHSPGCHWAKQIKPENIRCFANEQEAQTAGYVPGCIE